MPRASEASRLRAAIQEAVALAESGRSHEAVAVLRHAVPCPPAAIDFAATTSMPRANVNATSATTWTDPTTVGEAVSACLALPHVLTDWERGFLTDLRGWGSPSSRQVAIVRRIVEKCRRAATKGATG